MSWSRLSRPLGQQLAELPLDPRLGAALVGAGRAGCTEEVATIVAMLSVQVGPAACAGDTDDQLQGLVPCASRGVPVHTCRAGFCAGRMGRGAR